MIEDCNPTTPIHDFLSGFKTAAGFPNLKAVVGKISSLPGVSQFKGMQLQLLRVQSEILKVQLMLIEQLMQALEAAPEEVEPVVPSTPVPSSNGKIPVV
jgi:hypothetical protein